MPPQPNLVRKQILISKDQEQKVEQLASARGVSVAGVVRDAIDAYDPDHAHGLDTPDLMALVAQRLKEAITATRQANQKVEATLTQLTGDA